MALKLADKATIGMVVSTLLLAAILGGTAWASDENTDLRYIEFATAEASRPGVTVAEYEGNWENLDAAREEWSRIRLQDPCLEWAAASFVTGSDTGRVRLIEGASRYTGRALDDRRAAYWDKVSELTGLAATKNDMGKVTFFADWLNSNVIYYLPYAMGGSEDRTCTTPASALLDGVAVCTGYARAMRDLCLASGIDCVVVTDSAKQHAWVKVEVESTWYVADPTPRLFSASASNSPIALVSDDTYESLTGYRDGVSGIGCAIDRSPICPEL